MTVSYKYQYSHSKRLESGLNLSLAKYHIYYRPQRSCEGYVFTGVCLSTGGGVCLVPGGGGSALGRVSAVGGLVWSWGGGVCSGGVLVS